MSEENVPTRDEDTEIVKKMLLYLMEDISDWIYSASWYVDLEYILWEAVLRIGNVPESLQKTTVLLAYLSALCGGWWRYKDDGPNEPTFIPIDEWLDLYKRHQQEK